MYTEVVDHVNNETSYKIDRTCINLFAHKYSIEKLNRSFGSKAGEENFNALKGDDIDRLFDMRKMKNKGIPYISHFEFKSFKYDDIIYYNWGRYYIIVYKNSKKIYIYDKSNFDNLSNRVNTLFVTYITMNIYKTFTHDAEYSLIVNGTKNLYMKMYFNEVRRRLTRPPLVMPKNPRYNQCKELFALDDLGRVCHLVYYQILKDMAMTSSRIFLDFGSLEAEIHEHGNFGIEIYNMLIDSTLATRDMIEVSKLYHMFPSPDADPVIMCKSDLDNMNSNRYYNKETLEEFMAHTSAFNVSRILKKTKDICSVAINLYTPRKELEFVKSALNNISITPEKAIWDKISVEPNFIWEKHIELSFYNPSNVTRVSNEEKYYKVYAESFSDEFNELIWSLNCNGVFSARYSPKNVREMMKTGIKDRHIYCHVASKSENTKYSSKTRTTFSLCDYMREVLSEIERNMNKLKVMSSGISHGRSDVELNNHFHKLSAMMLDDKKFVSIAISLDVSGWSPKMPRKVQERHLNYLLSLFGNFDMCKYLTFMNKLKIVFNKAGHFFSYTPKEGSFQGWFGLSDTLLHSHMVAYAVYKAKELGIIDADETAYALTLIDDGVIIVKLRKDDNESNLINRVKTFFNHVVKIYKELGFEIDKVKTVISDNFFVYLNRIFCDGSEVATGYKTFIKIATEQSTFLSDISDVCSSPFNTAKGSSKTGFCPFASYKVAMLFSCIHMRTEGLLKKESHDKSFIHRMFAPKCLGGLGVPILASWSTGESTTSMSEYLGFMNLRSYAYDDSIAINVLKMVIFGAKKVRKKTSLAKNPFDIYLNLPSTGKTSGYKKILSYISSGKFSGVVAKFLRLSVKCKEWMEESLKVIFDEYSLDINKRRRQKERQDLLDLMYDLFINRYSIKIEKMHFLTNEESKDTGLLASVRSGIIDPKSKYDGLGFKNLKDVYTALRNGSVPIKVMSEISPLIEKYNNIYVDQIPMCALQLALISDCCLPSILKTYMEKFETHETVLKLFGRKYLSIAMHARKRAEIERDKEWYAMYRKCSFFELPFIPTERSVNIAYKLAKSDFNKTNNFFVVNDVVPSVHYALKIIDGPFSSSIPGANEGINTYYIDVMMNALRKTHGSYGVNLCDSRVNLIKGLNYGRTSSAIDLGSKTFLREFDPLSRKFLHSSLIIRCVEDQIDKPLIYLFCKSWGLLTMNDLPTYSAITSFSLKRVVPKLCRPNHLLNTYTNTNSIIFMSRIYSSLAVFKHGVLYDPLAIIGSMRTQLMLHNAVHLSRGKLNLNDQYLYVFAPFVFSSIEIVKRQKLTNHIELPQFELPDSELVKGIEGLKTRRINIRNYDPDLSEPDMARYISSYHKQIDLLLLTEDFVSDIAFPKTMSLMPATNHNRTENITDKFTMKASNLSVVDVFSTLVGQNVMSLSYKFFDHCLCESIYVNLRENSEIAYRIRTNGFESISEGDQLQTCVLRSECILQIIRTIKPLILKSIFAALDIHGYPLMINEISYANFMYEIHKFPKNRKVMFYRYATSPYNFTATTNWGDRKGSLIAKMTYSDWLNRMYSDFATVRFGNYKDTSMLVEEFEYNIAYYKSIGRNWLDIIDGAEPQNRKYVYGAGTHNQVIYLKLKRERDTALKKAKIYAGTKLNDQRQLSYNAMVKSLGNSINEGYDIVGKHEEWIAIGEMYGTLTEMLNDTWTPIIDEWYDYLSQDIYTKVHKVRLGGNEGIKLLKQTTEEFEFVPCINEEMNKPHVIVTEQNVSEILEAAKIDTYKEKVSSKYFVSLILEKITSDMSAKQQELVKLYDDNLMKFEVLTSELNAKLMLQQFGNNEYFQSEQVDNAEINMKKAATDILEDDLRKKYYIISSMKNESSFLYEIYKSLFYDDNFKGKTEDLIRLLDDTKDIRIKYGIPLPPDIDADIEKAVKHLTNHDIMMIRKERTQLMQDELDKEKEKDVSDSVKINSMTHDSKGKPLSEKAQKMMAMMAKRKIADKVNNERPDLDKMGKVQSNLNSIVDVAQTGIVDMCSGHENVKMEDRLFLQMAGAIEQKLYKVTDEDLEEIRSSLILLSIENYEETRFKIFMNHRIDDFNILREAMKSPTFLMKHIWKVIVTYSDTKYPIKSENMADF